MPILVAVIEDCMVLPYEIEKKSAVLWCRDLIVVEGNVDSGDCERLYWEYNQDL